jgi:hypothetical protein
LLQDNVVSLSFRAVRSMNAKAFLDEVRPVGQANACAGHLLDLSSAISSATGTVGIAAKNRDGLHFAEE